MTHELRFRCTQGWDSMQLIGGGRRHCAHCDRPVYDLTRFTLRQALRFREEHPSACVHVVARAGTNEIVFRPERVRLPVAGALVAAALGVGCAGTQSGEQPEAVTAAPLQPTPAEPYGGTQPTAQPEAATALPLEPKPAEHGDTSAPVARPDVSNEEPPELPRPSRRNLPREAPAAAATTTSRGAPAASSHTGTEFIDGGW